MLLTPSQSKLLTWKEKWSSQLLQIGRISKIVYLHIHSPASWLQRSPWWLSLSIFEREDFSGLSIVPCLLCTLAISGEVLVELGEQFVRGTQSNKARHNHGDGRPSSCFTVYRRILPRPLMQFPQKRIFSILLYKCNTRKKSKQGENINLDAPARRPGPCFIRGVAQLSFVCYWQEIIMEQHQRPGQLRV
jgi:hypothetical protein